MSFHESAKDIRTDYNLRHCHLVKLIHISTFMVRFALYVKQLALAKVFQFTEITANNFSILGR